MLNLGLSKKEWEWLDNALANSHSMRTTIRLTDLVGNERADLSKRLLGGQVDVDAEADITRTASVVLLDPEGKISFSSESPSDAAMYFDDMLEIERGVFVPEMNEWVDIPIFTGPITSLSRNGEEISVECAGKEYLSNGTLWTTFTAKKGANKVAIIKELLSKRGGENRFNFERHKGRLGKDFSLSAFEDNAWDGAKKLARSVNKHLFYNGRGVARLRSHENNVVFTFRDGEGGTVLTPPQISFAFDNMRNAVLVRGKKENGKKQITARAVAPRNHVLSPWNIGRNGVPRYLGDVVDNDNIDTYKEAVQVAERKLRQWLDQDVEVTFDAMAIPYIEENDKVRLRTDGWATTFQVKQFTIPLVAADPMAVGYNKRLPLRRKKRLPNHMKSKKKRGKRK